MGVCECVCVCADICARYLHIYIYIYIYTYIYICVYIYTRNFVALRATMFGLAGASVPRLYWEVAASVNIHIYVYIYMNISVESKTSLPVLLEQILCHASALN